MFDFHFCAEFVLTVVGFTGFKPTCCAFKDILFKGLVYGPDYFHHWLTYFLFPHKSINLLLYKMSENPQVPRLRSGPTNHPNLKTFRFDQIKKTKAANLD